jgi:hypothetical protein
LAHRHVNVSNSKWRQSIAVKREPCTWCGGRFRRCFEAERIDKRGRFLKPRKECLERCPRCRPFRRILADACLSDGLNDVTLNLSFGQQWIDNRPFTRPLDKRGCYPISLNEVESRRKVGPRDLETLPQLGAARAGGWATRSSISVNMYRGRGPLAATAGDAQHVTLNFRKTSQP